MKPLMLIIILFLNTLVALSIFLIPGMAIKRKWCLSSICITTPIIGIVGIGLVFLSRKLFRQQDIGEDDLSIKLPGLDYVSDVNFEKEVNVVPVEEALLINPDRTKRQMVMEAIKHNPADYLMSLKKALHADDSETAHYAASGITDVKRILERDLLEASAKYKEKSNNRNYVNHYIRALSNMIESQLSVDIMQRRYQLQLVSVIETFIDSGMNVEEKMYELLLDTLMMLDGYQEAIQWAQRFVEAYPDNEKSLMYVLNISYTLKNNQVFQHALNDLKQPRFATSTQTRDIIAYWDKANAN
jgi:tetratricopeptide (TPR) repeat protein